MALKDMKVTTSTVFLALNRNGLVKATKTKSDLRRDEIGVLLRLRIPTSAFQSPYIEANINVPGHAVVVPEIEAEVIEP